MISLLLNQEPDSLVDPILRDDLPCHTGDPDLFFAERPGDLEKAKALLTEAGFPNGFKTTLSFDLSEATTRERFQTCGRL